MSVDYLAGCRPYVPATPFRKWIESALPGVYDESLSLYELMAKLLKSFGDVIERVDGMGETSNGLLLAFTQLKTFVEQATEDMDVERRVSDALEQAADDGTLESLIQRVIEGMDIEAGSVEVDTTLSKEGMAADAKATGDAIKSKVGVDGVNDAVNTALVRAKANGDFKGDKGDKGDPGRVGPYYTPVVTDNGDGTFTMSFRPSATGVPTPASAIVVLPRGADGEAGKSAYEYALEGGYTGTKEEFAELMASGTNGLPMPDTAEVGQFIVVSAIDDNGKVTATDAVTLADAEGVGF